VYRRLAPVAFDHYITVMTVLPARRNPYGMRTRWRFPAALLPGIGVAIPTVVSPDPDVLTTWANAAMLNNEPGRRDLYYHLRCLSDACSYSNRK
jgi:hypothetical protein